MSIASDPGKYDSVPLTQYILIILFLIFMLGYGVLEVIDELQELSEGESPMIAWSEIVIVFFSIIILMYISSMLFKKQSEQARLTLALQSTRKQLETSNLRLQKGKEDFRKVIDWQFDEWRLTPSEKEVAMHLLKGLSVKEIADKRHTQVKTVRKHASAIYDKSNLAGRHLLSAWFFEDLL